MVPTQLSVQELLAEIRHLLIGKDPESESVKAKLSALVNQPGAADLLFNVLQTGDAFETQQAAFGLVYARSDLIRRKLRNLAKQSEGDRRLACLSALTPDELSKFLDEQGEGARKTLLESSSLIALNRPDEFVDLVCEGAAAVDADTIGEIEQMRLAYRIGAVSLYAPLLQRPLTDAALAQVATILGTAPGAEVKELLKKVLSRTKDEVLTKTLRREQMRQASLEIRERVVPTREGAAVLRPVQSDGLIWLEVYEQLPGDWSVQSSVCWSPKNAPEFMTTPLEGEASSYLAGTMEANVDAKLSLGQAKAILESFTKTQRTNIAPVLDRLADVETEDYPSPPIGPTLSDTEAAELVRHPMWSAWRPFKDVVSPETNDLTSLIAKLYEKRGGATQLAAGLRHMSVVMFLRGDSGSDRVAAEAVWAAKKRPSALVRALASLELAK